MYYFINNTKKLKNYFIENFKFFVGLPAFIWQILFLLIPFLIIVASSFMCQTCAKLDFTFFSSIINFDHFKIIWRTLIISLINTIICLIIGYPVAYYIAFRTEVIKNFLITLLMLPLWISFLVQVYSWFFILEHNGIINTVLLKLGIIKHPLSLMNNLFGVIIVMVYIYLPFMIMPLYNNLEKFNFQLLEASANLGASKFQTFWKVTFPLSLSGIYLGFFLVFSMSYGEVAIPMLLGGNKSFFSGVLISQYFVFNRNVSKGAAFTVLNAIVLVVFMAILYLLMKKKHKVRLNVF